MSLAKPEVKAPQPATILGNLSDTDNEYLKRSSELIAELSNNLEKCSFQAGIKNIMALAALGNKYIDEKAPWNQIKTDKDACATTLNVALRMVKRLAIVTVPYLPFSAQRLWIMLGYEGNVNEQKWDEAFADITPGQKFSEIKPLFKKLEPEEEDQIGLEKELEESPLNVRVGKVTEVKIHPNAEKLIILEVSLGDETRTLVAGLREYYKPEDLEGKNIAVLCNLKPAKLRGIESKGMLLAAEDDKEVGVLFAEGGEPGETILGNKDAPEVSFSEFQNFRLEVIELDEPKGAKGAALFIDDDKFFILKANKRPILVDKDMKPGCRIR